MGGGTPLHIRHVPVLRALALPGGGPTELPRSIPTLTTLSALSSPSVWGVGCGGAECSQWKAVGMPP